MGGLAGVIGPGAGAGVAAGLFGLEPAGAFCANAVAPAKAMIRKAVETTRIFFSFVPPFPGDNSCKPNSFRFVNNMTGGLLR